MLLTQADIDELKEIHREEFGETLSNAEAWAMGYRLLRLFAVLYKVPLPGDEGPQTREF